jgi:hypothetical protein
MLSHLITTDSTLQQMKNIRFLWFKTSIIYPKIVRLARLLHYSSVIQTHTLLCVLCDTTLRYSYNLTDILWMKSGHPKLLRTVIRGWTSIYIFTDYSFLSITSLHINKKGRVKGCENVSEHCCACSLKLLHSHFNAVLDEENGGSSLLTFFSSMKCILRWIL